jgi:hypothetical protein
MTRPLLRFGSRGEAVSALQQALNQGTSTQAKLVGDGIFGSKTHGRVLEFQRQNKLQVDGVVGDQTHTSLEPLYKLIEKLVLPTPPGEQAARDSIVRVARLAAVMMGWPESAPPPPNPARQNIASRVGLGTPVNAKGDQLRQGGLALATIYGTARHPFASQCLHIPAEHIQFFRNNPNPPASEKNKRMPDWCGIFCLYVYRTSGLRLSDWPLRLLGSAREFQTVAKVAQIKPGDLALVSPFGGGRNHHFLVGDIQGTKIRSIDGNAGRYSSIIEREYSIVSQAMDNRGAFRLATPLGIEPVVFASPIWTKALT